MEADQHGDASNVEGTEIMNGIANAADGICAVRRSVVKIEVPPGYEDVVNRQAGKDIYIQNLVKCNGDDLVGVVTEGAGDSGLGNIRLDTTLAYCPVLSRQFRLEDFCGRMEEGKQLDVNPTALTASKKKRKEKWGPDADLILIKAWLNTDKDPIVENNQKGDGFWKRVAKNYNSNCVSGTVRMGKACKQHFGILSRSVAKFSGYYGQAKDQWRNGESENDVLMHAKDLYRRGNNNSTFSYQHAWFALRDEPKWKAKCETASSSKGGNSKRMRINEAGSFSLSCDQPRSDAIQHDANECPLVDKAAKLAKKKCKVLQTEPSLSFKYLKIWDELERKRITALEDMTRTMKDVAQINSTAMLEAKRYDLLMHVMEKEKRTPQEEMMFNKLVSEFFSSVDS